MTDNISDMEHRIATLECWAAATDERWRNQEKHNATMEGSMKAVMTKLESLVEKVTANSVRLTVVMGTAVTIGSLLGAGLVRLFFPTP